MNPVRRAEGRHDDHDLHRQRSQPADAGQLQRHAHKGTAADVSGISGIYAGNDDKSSKNTPGPISRYSGRSERNGRLPASGLG